jgi:hypothetical protein
MAKAVCPKCKRLFGENPLYSITTGAVEEEDAEDKDDTPTVTDVPESAGDDGSDAELQDDPDVGLQDDPEAGLEDDPEAGLQDDPGDPEADGDDE